MLLAGSILKNTAREKFNGNTGLKGAEYEKKDSMCDGSLFMCIAGSERMWTDSV